jgi:alkylation response protein AidB-like acyl-CoA dehydrogenase
MARLAQTTGLTDIQVSILDTVREFVDKEIIPHAQQLEHADEYPADIVAGMREMGLFGLTIAEEHGGLGESLLTYALVVEQLSRGWMSISGIVNTHFIVAYLISQHGSADQKARLLSNGQKMWLTNGSHASVVATLVKTDTGADSVYGNMTTFLLEKEPGFGETAPGLTIPGKIEKMGYKGVETTEMILDGHVVSATAVLGGAAGVGRGFYQMMDGIEVGRVNVAARACGISLRAFELAVAYSQQRQTFGAPLYKHQAIAFKIAEMGTKIEAAHALMVNAARLKDSGQRNDVEAGMAKLLASEYCAEIVQESFRIHGGYGYSKEYEIERLMREAPFLLIGEGTSEIQKTIISRGLLKEYRA